MGLARLLAKSSLGKIQSCSRGVLHNEWLTEQLLDVEKEQKSAVWMGEWAVWSVLLEYRVKVYVQLLSQIKYPWTILHFHHFMYPPIMVASSFSAARTHIHFVPVVTHSRRDKSRVYPDKAKLWFHVLTYFCTFRFVTLIKTKPNNDTIMV